MCFVVCSDAGGINTKEYELVDQDGLPTDATQGGWIVLAAEKLPVGKSSIKASPISWRSSKLKRKVLSTFGGETQTMLQGVNEVDWHCSMTFSRNPGGTVCHHTWFWCLSWSQCQIVSHSVQWPTQSLFMTVFFVSILVVSRIVSQHWSWRSFWGIFRKPSPWFVGCLTRRWLQTV